MCVCVSVCLRQTVVKDGQFESVGPFSEIYQRINKDGLISLYLECDPVDGGSLSACGAGTSTTSHHSVNVFMRMLIYTTSRHSDSGKPGW